MLEEEMKERIIRLEEQIRAAEKALNLAQNNVNTLVAQMLSITSLVVSIYAIFRK
jgi:hypothetical protein